MSQDSGPEGPWPCLCNDRTFCWCRSDCEAAQHSEAANAKDAARYRWLRDRHIGDSPESVSLTPARKPGLDAAIDAAMSKRE